jgi:anti-sigma regulatory factor (Ser/Thr protein kinase)
MDSDDRYPPGRGWVPVVARSASIPFSPVLDAPRDVRSFVSDTVRGWGFGDLAESAKLLVSEVVTNVVLHARTNGEATVEALPSGVRVAIRDADPTLPEIKHPLDSTPDGRGLEIVATLARRWGVDRADDGSKVVWFELDDDSDPGRDEA